MRMLKRISLISFLFIVIFVLVGSIDIKTNAVLDEYENSNLVIVNGAGIRTSGNEGLRFECNTKYIPYSGYNYTKYGALIAYGTIENTGVFATVSSYIRAYYVQGSKINNHSILDAYTTEVDSDGTYYVTLFNIPEEYYLQDITILPYVITEGQKIMVYTYGSAVVTRNLGEIALAYLNDGGSTTTLLDNVVTKLTNDYRVTYTDTVGNFYISSLVYESNPKNIYKQFARDWNKEYQNIQIPTTIDASNFQSIVSEVSSNTTAIMEDCPLVKFLIKYKSKYGWILSYLTRFSAYLTKPVNYIETGVVPSYDKEDWRNGSYLINCWLGFFAQVDVTSVSLTNFAYNVDAYNDFVDKSLYNHSIYSDLINNEVTIIKTNSDITMPSLADNKLWKSTEYFDDSTKAVENNKYLPEYCLNIKNDNRYYVFTQSEISTDTINSVAVDGMNNNKTVISNCAYKGIDVLSSGFTGTLSIANNASNVTFENINFNDCELICVNDDQGCTLSNITFKDCVINVDTNKNFINWNSADGSYCENITFENCTFYSINTTTSNDYANSFITITNNKNLTITDSEFYNAKNSAINIKKSTNGLGEIGCILIQNNYFNECLNDAITIEYIDLANDASLLSYNNYFNYEIEYKSYFHKIVNCTLPTTNDKVVFNYNDASYSQLKIVYQAHTNVYQVIKCTYDERAFFQIEQTGVFAD